MQIGIPTETVVGENRVAATPETVKKLISAGHSVVIERGAGVKAAYIDSAYEQVGATITDDAYTGSQIILKVRAPQGGEIQKLAANTTVVAMFDPYRNTELDQFANQQVSAFALELLPRTLSRAQNMDVLSSQANLAGYKSVLLAAAEYQRMFPMLMTAAGTVKPARVVIMGVGVAGLQAIATAKRLGAIVEATDLRPTAKDQVESLGGKWLDVPMSEEEQQRAAGVLIVIKITPLNQFFPYIQAHGLNLGILILTIGVLTPIASGKLSGESILKSFISFKSLVAIAIGLLVAWLGGRGVKLMSSQPDVVAGLLIGTVAGVALLRGVPVGPLIAAGLLSLFIGK